MQKFMSISVAKIPSTRLSRYLAHDGELLELHISRTKERFLGFCEDGLENVLDRQIAACFRYDHEIVKDIIHDMVCLHDIGKLNPSFQKIKLNNEVVTGWDDPDSNHSEVGWLIFMALFWDRIEQVRDDNDYLNLVILTTVIAGHHTYAWGVADRCSGKNPTEDGMKRARRIAQAAGFELKEDNCRKAVDFWKEFEWHKSNKQISPVLFSLYKTLYSLLILSDSTATADAKNDGGNRANEQINDTDIMRWRKSFSSTPHMQSFLYSKEKLRAALSGSEDINTLRSKILLETQANLEDGVRSGKRVFYLEAPTGAGKTNCSINLALRVLELDRTIKHAVFVFPFINIIEQNVDVIKRAIGAEAGDVLEVHHLSEWGHESDEDADTGRASARYDQRLFLNSKITMTSSVNFLEALGSSRKNANYKICNMCNSVIVLDEIQSLDDEQWTYVNFLLDGFANENNCYIILMSATLPRIDKIGFTENKCNFSELLPNAKAYQEHACFRKRTQVSTRLEVNTVEEVVDLIRNELADAKRPMKVLAVMNTVKRSKELYVIMPKEFETATGRSKFQVMLLNSELLPHKKREVIKAAKTENVNLVVVSTQCIEAGVDADFDFGVRDYAIPDSIEQVAGRINRENKKDAASLHVVNIHGGGRYDSKTIYGRGRRWAAMENMGQTKVADALINRAYDGYYEQILEVIREKNLSGDLRDIRGRTETLAAEGLRLYALKDFRAIKDDRKISFFIPLNLPVDEFSETERRTLIGLNKQDPKFPFVNDGEVCGRRVWDEYERIKQTPGRKGLIAMSRFASILSKFIANRRPMDGETRDQFLTLLESWEGIYDLNKGFIDSDGFF